LTEDQQFQAMEAFRNYDADRSGTIDKGELKNLLRAMMGAKTSDSTLLLMSSQIRVLASSGLEIITQTPAYLFNCVGIHKPDCNF
jgi:Ca2+-binding EF-hand superfamily protein